MRTKLMMIAAALLISGAPTKAIELEAGKVPTNMAPVRLAPLGADLAKPLTGIVPGAGISVNALTPEVKQALSDAGLLTEGMTHISLIPQIKPDFQGAAQSPEATLTGISQTVEKLPDLTNVEGGAAATAGQNLEDAVTGRKSIAGAGEVSVDAAPTASIQEQVAWAKGKLDGAITELGKVIIGHQKPIKEIVIAMTAGQHVLLEGLPGDGKTQTAKTVADVFGGKYSRIQFTADLQPADITGSMVFNQQKGEFAFRPGPIFGNIVLGDEFNRAPPRTHSAMLEAMGEGHVTVDGKKMPLPRFTVLATQNPVEQDGTYKSPEAELDRFMFKSKFDQPDEEGLIKIMRLKRFKDKPPVAGQVATLEQLDEIRRVSERIGMDESIERYIAKLVRAARTHDEIKGQVKYSVYTRAAQFLEQAARIHAVMEGRDYVTPHDVREMIYPIMRHRISLDYSAGEKDPDEVIAKILDVVKVPETQNQARLALKGTANKPGR